MFIDKIKSAAMPLLVFTVVVYILQLSLGDWFTNSFMMIASDVFVRPWTLLTSVFLHSLHNPFHIVFNMLVLFFFGPLVEERIGPVRFLFLYVVSGILASFVASFFYSAALGASGAIMGMLGVAVILMPKLRVLLWGIVPMTLATLVLLVIAIDVFNTLAATNIATAAHFTGLAVGAGYGLYLKKHQKQFRKKFSSSFELDDDDIAEYLRSGRL